MNEILLVKLPDYEFDFRNHDSDNSGLRWFNPDDIEHFWSWCEDHDLIPLGFCKIPRYRKECGVGFLFEDKNTFNKVWFHIPQVSYCSVVRTLFGSEQLEKIWLEQ